MSLDIHELERVIHHRYRKTAYGMRFLDPATRSALIRFEKAVRDYADQHSNELATEYKQSYIQAKRALVRRILRITGEIPPDSRGRKKEPR